LEKEASVEDRSVNVLLRARIYARMGKRKEAREILDASRGRNAQLLATVHAALGDKDDAFRLLFMAIEEPRGLPVYVNTDPPFDSLHSDPRWKEVLRRMNLPTDRESAAQGANAR
jgi:hypothetical protein